MVNKIDALKRIAQQNNVDGYFGPLYELFDTDAAYRVAVESIAGGSLFHIVVDTSATARRLLDLTAHLPGRVTFLPINQLRFNPVAVPQGEGIIAMMSTLRFNARYTRALEVVFAKTVICDTLDTAIACAKSHNLTAITLTGTKVEGRGAMTGGYREQKSSRLETIHRLQHARKEYDLRQTEQIRLETEARDLEQRYEEARGRHLKAKDALHRWKEARGPLAEDVRRLDADESSVQHQLARKVQHALC